MLNLIIEKPQLIAVFLSYPLFLWFLFICCYAGKKYTRQSMILTVTWLFYCCCFIFNLFGPLSIKEVFCTIIFIDTATGLILVTDRFISTYSCKLAITVAFAVLCHSMILLHKSTDSSEVVILTVGFYTYYDELIATVGILQLLVTFNGGFTSGIKGFIRSPRLPQERLLRSYGFCLHYIKGCYLYLKKETSEERT